MTNKKILKDYFIHLLDAVICNLGITKTVNHSFVQVRHIFILLYQVGQRVFTLGNFKYSQKA